MKTATEYAGLGNTPLMDWTSSFEDRRDYIQSIIDESIAHGMTISAEIVGKDAIVEQQTACWSVLAERKKLLLIARDNKVWSETK
jgi:hypothetical protein